MIVDLPTRATLTAVLVGAVATALAIAQQPYDANAARYVISGRVVDPHRLWPAGAVLTLGERDNESYSKRPIALHSDGSFVTPSVGSGTYVLELARPVEDRRQEGPIVGLSIVEVTARDVSGVIVEVRRDTAITGIFRMETDNPGAKWPTEIIVNAFLALDGSPLVNGTLADGAPGGTFVLRNAFGPRVLRCGWVPAPGAWWWPSQVFLDGRDITNVPTDFSEHENARLEVVFTQNPARILGVVTIPGGQPVRVPWILTSSADPKLRQQWATTNSAQEGNTQGRFSVPVLPGTYFIRAVPQTTFDSFQSARRQILRLTSGSETVDVHEREIKTVNLTLRP